MVVPPVAASSERLLAWLGAHPLVVAGTAVLLAILVWLAITRSRGDPRLRFRVEAVPAFFTRAEHRFYSLLRPVAADLDLVVFAKVGLNDIFRGSRGAYRGQYGRYAQMHVDFLLVTSHDFRPVAGIEVDGDSHLTAIQQDRDRRKDAVFKTAGVPLLRFPNDAGLSQKVLRQHLEVAAGKRLRARV